MAKKITWEDIKSRIFKNWISLFSLPLTFLLIEQISNKAPLSQIIPTVGGILAVLFGVDKKKTSSAEEKKAAVKKAKTEIKKEVVQKIDAAAEEHLNDPTKKP